MSTTPETREALKKTVLFSDFTAEEIEQFIDLCDITTAAPGELIVKQDDHGDSMYVLVSGEAKVKHHKDGREIDLAKLCCGDFFGELALVDEGVRSADVIAEQSVTLLRITQGVISAVAGVYPTAAFKFLVSIGRILVSRLRQTNQRYIDSMLLPLEGKD